MSKNEVYMIVLPSLSDDIENLREEIPNMLIMRPKSIQGLLNYFDSSNENIETILLSSSLSLGSVKLPKIIKALRNKKPGILILVYKNLDIHDSNLTDDSILKMIRGNKNSPGDIFEGSPNGLPLWVARQINSFERNSSEDTLTNDRGDSQVSSTNNRPVDKQEFQIDITHNLEENHSSIYFRGKILTLSTKSALMFHALVKAGGDIVSNQRLAKVSEVKSISVSQRISVLKNELKRYTDLPIGSILNERKQGYFYKPQRTN